MKHSFKGIVLLLLFIINGVSDVAAQKQPNVIFIISDDLRTELNCYGATHIKSPNIDKLAQNGVLFKRAYVQQAVCSASRASFLSGCRPDVTGVDYPYSQYFVNEFWPAHPSIPEYFERQGYEVNTFGKIHHGTKDKLKTEHYAPEYLKHYALSENIKLGGDRGRSIHTPPYECADVEDEAYQDGMVTKMAVAKIRELSGKNKPFFLGVGYLKPHLPFCAPKKYWDMYNRNDIPLSKNPLHPDGSPEYSTVHFELGHYSEQRDANGTGIPEDMQRTLKHAYAACVSYIDAQVGKLLTQLEESGELENTIIVFIADHGWHLGDQGMWGKHTNFENATWAPMIISAPNYAKGLVLNQLVEYVDVYPSLLELAGFKPADYLEGTSVVPLIKNPDLAWKSAVFSQFPRSDDFEGYAIRTDRYRYVEWRKKSKNSVVAIELYDHNTDSLESKNVATEEKYKTVVEELSKRLNKGWKAALPEGIVNNSHNVLAPPFEGWGPEAKKKEKK